MKTITKLILVLISVALLAACEGEPEVLTEWPEEVTVFITTVDDQPLDIDAWEAAGWEVDLSRTVISPHPDCTLRPVDGRDQHYTGRCASILVLVPVTAELITAVYTDFENETTRMVQHVP